MKKRLTIAGITLAWAIVGHAQTGDEPSIAPDFCQVASRTTSGAFEHGRAAYRAGEFRGAIAYLNAFVASEKELGESSALLPALELLARSYKVIGCDDEAILRQQEHRELAARRGDTAAACRSDSRLARLLLQRDSATAESLAIQAQECALSFGDTETASEALSTLAVRRMVQSRYDESDKLLTDALDAAHTPLMRAEALRFRGVFRTQRRPIDLPGAIDDFDRSVHEADAAGDPEALASAQIYRWDAIVRAPREGPEMITRGREAAEQAAAAEERARQSGMRRISALSALLAGERETGLEGFGNALAELNRARALLTAIGDDALVHTVSLRLANLLWLLGREHFDEAIEAAHDSQRSALRAGYPGEAGKANHTLGLIALDRGEITQALSYFHEYLTIAEREGAPRDRARVLNDLARAELRADAPRAAIEHLSAAAVLASAINDLDLEAAIEITLGWALDRSGQPTEAIPRYHHVLTLVPGKGGGLRRAGAYWGLARTQASTRPAVAIAYYKAAVRELEAVVRTAGIPGMRAFEAFGQRYSNMYRELAALLVAQERPFEAQRTAELMQQQELRERQWLTTRAKGGVDPVELTASEQEALACQDPKRFRVWLDKRDALRRSNGNINPACCINDAAAHPNCKNDSSSLHYCDLQREFTIYEKGLNREREDCLELIQSRLAAQAKRGSEGFLSQMFQDSWERATRGQRVTLIVTLVQDNALHVMAARRPFSGVSWKKHTVPKEELANLANDIRVSMAKISAMRGAASRDQLSKEASRLRDGPLHRFHDLLIAPFGRDALRADGKGAPVIALALDGVLRGVPIAALFDGKRYLVEDFAIVVVTPSTVAAPARDHAAKQALVMGVSKTDPPLPYVVDEVREVAKRLHQRGYLDEDATGIRLTQWLEGLDRPALALHLASHGVFGGSKTSTKIMLWQHDELSGSELERLSEKLTKVQLFTMSACQTAQSLDDLAFGLAGIAERGARSVVGSLWNVADDVSTARLMSRFYERITAPYNSVGTAEALQGAQLAIRKDFEHPYFWAPFVLVGRWD